MGRVFFARGHGKRPDGTWDPGATHNGWNEQSATDIVTPVAAAYVRKHGHWAYDEGENDPNFIGSTRHANRLHETDPLDLFVALHFDWYIGWDSHAYFHSTSSLGRDAAGTIVRSLENLGRPIQSFRTRSRDSLYVLSHTHFPATLVELGRIGDPSNDEVSELKAIGEAVGRGVVDYLDRHAPPPSRERRAVAVTAARSPDTEYAAMLGYAHTFAYVERHGNSWVQIYPDGSTKFVDEVDYLVAVGYKAKEKVSEHGRGVPVQGPNKFSTRKKVVDLILTDNPSRTEPWSDL